MSKVKLYTILVTLILLGQISFLLAYETPDPKEDGIVASSEEAHTDFVETTYDDPDCDLDTDGIIDYNDLAAFCDDWLTQAVWAKGFTCGDGGDIMHNIGQSMGRTMTAAFASQESAAVDLSVSAEQPLEKVEPLEVEKVDIAEILDWLDEIWLDPEVRKVITEDEWLEFVRSIKECWEVR